MDLSSSSKLITAREASALTGYVADYITRQCRTGKIDSKQVGRVWLIDEASLLSHFAGEAERKEKNAKELARQRELEYAEAKKKREEAVPVETPVESPYAPVPAHPSWFTEEVPGRHLRGSFASLALTLTLLAGGLYAGLEETRSAGLAVVRETGTASVRTALYIATALRGDASPKIAVTETEEVHEEEKETHEVSAPELSFEIPSVAVVALPELTKAELAIEEKHHIDTAVVVDPVVHALTSFGVFIQDTTHTILNIHEEGTYAFVETAPEVPEKIVAAIHDIGYTIASLGNQAPGTSIAFVRSLEGEALGVIGNVALMYDTTKDTIARAYDMRVTAPEESRQYAVQEAGSLKPVADSAPAPESVATSYNLQATSSVPSYIYGMAGAGASGALAGLEGVAVFTYETLNGLFAKTGNAFASLFAPKEKEADSLKLVADSAPTPEPKSEPTSYQPVSVRESQSSTLEAQSFSSPIYNEYYTVTSTGVSKEYVDAEIRRHIDNLDDRIDTRLDNVGGGGGGGGSGSVTSVDMSGGTTGLSFAGGPITSSGTFTLSGTLAIANGGTGTSTAPSYGQLLLGNSLGGYDLVATSSLGFDTGTVISGTTGELPYYAGNGTTLTATSSVFLATSGSVGIGTTTPVAKLSVLSATEQLRVGYDSTNYANLTVSSAGNLTLGTTGSTGNMTFNVPNGASWNWTMGGFGRMALDNSRLYPTATLDLGTSGNRWSVLYAGLINANTMGNNYLAGNLGIGTTSPFAKSSIHANNGETNSTLFAIGSSTASATTTLFSVNNTGIATAAAGFVSPVGIAIGNGVTAAAGLASGQFNLYGSGVQRASLNTAGLVLQDTSTIGWTSTSNSQGTKDTGLSRLAAGVLGLGNGTQGTYAGTLITERIGLGTTTPYAQLSIVATSTTGLGAPTTLFAIASTTQGTATSTLFSVLNNGNVGIGTASPLHLLAIESSVDASIQSTLTNESAGTGATAVMAVRNGSTANDSLRLRVNGTGFTTSGANFEDSGHLLTGANLSNGLSISATSVTGILRFYTGGAADANERLRIDASGNVGIGTTSPTGTLHIADANSGSAGNSGAQLILEDTSFGLLQFLGNGNTQAIYFNDAGGSAGRIQYSHSLDALGLWTSGTEKLTVAASGNVGIGTTSPWRTLSVDGTMAVTGLTNDSTGFYVCANTATGEFSTSTTACGASSERFKTDIEDMEYGLDAVLALRPVAFEYKDSYIENAPRQLGFIAEEVDLVIPELVARSADGTIQGLDYPKFVAVIVKSVQDIVNIQGVFREKLIAWFADSANGIGDFVANRIRTVELCVTDEDGETCLTRAQLQDLLAGVGAVEASDGEDEGEDQNGGGSGGETPIEEPPAEEPPTEEPPVEEPPSEEPPAEEPPSEDPPVTEEGPEESDDTEEPEEDAPAEEESGDSEDTGGGDSEGGESPDGGV